MKKHEIDWTNVPINTKLQIKGTDSWSAENGWDSTVPITEFTECRFADEEMEKEYWKD